MCVYEWKNEKDDEKRRWYVISTIHKRARQEYSAGLFA
jgi:hypothetical protein